MGSSRSPDGLTRFSKIGGEMVPHVRVEEALNDAIGAEEPVFAVTAIADGRDGDRLAVLHTTCDDRVNEALEKMRKLGLPNLYLPRRDSFVKVDALPLLGTGKLDLRSLKRIASGSPRSGRRELRTACMVDRRQVSRS